MRRKPMRPSPASELMALAPMIGRDRAQCVFEALGDLAEASRRVEAQPDLPNVRDFARYTIIAGTFIDGLPVRARRKLRGSVAARMVVEAEARAIALLEQRPEVKRARAVLAGVAA